MKAPRVTVTGVRDLVQIIVRGQPRPSHPPDWPMYLPDDGGIVRRLLDWTREQGIWPAVVNMSSGGGYHCAFYTSADAERIFAWLAEQGVERVDEHPGDP